MAGQVVMAAEIDLLPTLSRFEDELLGGMAATRLALILGILQRWQSDMDLTAHSRKRACELLKRFDV